MTAYHMHLVSDATGETVNSAHTIDVEFHKIQGPRAGISCENCDRVVGRSGGIDVGAVRADDDVASTGETIDSAAAIGVRLDKAQHA